MSKSAWREIHLPDNEQSEGHPIARHIRYIEIGALTELQSEIEKLKAELDAANACIQTIDRNLAFEKRRTFECRNCHTQMYPVFDKLALRLDKENIELREQTDKLAEFIKSVAPSWLPEQIRMKKYAVLTEYKKWKAGK